MIFIKETGAILNPQRSILHIVEGNAGMVIFPDQTIWNLHKSSMGCVYALSHIHPNGMTMLSHEDETTLRAWCVALFPHPLRIITITHMRSDSFTKEHAFRETCYVGLMEAKETWLTHKDQPRKFEIIKEWERDFFIENPKKAMNDWYGLTLVRKSYEFDEIGVN